MLKKSPNPFGARKLVGLVVIAVAVGMLGVPAHAKKRSAIAARVPAEAAGERLPAPSRPTGLAATFEALALNTWVNRSVVLPDVGVNTAIVMGGAQTLRDIYFPVPAHVPLLDASVQVNAGYLRADPGRTTLVYSLDNSPVMAKAITGEKGDATQSLSVASTPQPSGFVRLGVAWNTVIPLNAADSTCTDMRSQGNLLRIDPSTRLSYRFDAAGLRDLSMAWTAMPPQPVVLVSGKSLSADAYDAAWRVGLTLERAGRRAQVVTLPGVGQEVDTSALSVPDGLHRIPAFSALSQGGRRVLKDAAEVGAWLAITQLSGQHIDVVISDNPLGAALSAALSALAAQIKMEVPDAAPAFERWRATRLDALTRVAAPGEMSLAVSSGGATLVVAADAGAKFAEVFDTPWRKLAASSAMVVRTADQPAADKEAVLLSALGSAPGSLDVVGYGEWVTKFDIGSGLLKGRRPAELVMDLSAAPSTWGTVPVASVFLNEVLLASTQMAAKGQRERLRATIPSYALGVRNVVRVSFVRQLLSDRCRENPGAFPVAVLPSSHMVLGEAPSGEDFTGMAARLAQGGELWLPSGYLADVPQSLARVIRLSAAAEVSPGKAKLAWASADGQARPVGPFMAMDVGFAAEKRKVRIDSGALVLADDKERKLLDITGLSRVGTVSVERVDGKPGVVYHTVAGDIGRYDKPFQLMQGNFAVIGPDGLIAQFDSRSDADSPLFDETTEPWFKRYVWWVLPLAAILGFLGLLFAASVYRRRKSGG